jgi:hypothetical protein
MVVSIPVSIVVRLEWRLATGSVTETVRTGNACGSP